MIDNDFTGRDRLIISHSPFFSWWPFKNDLFVLSTRWSVITKSNSKNYFDFNGPIRIKWEIFWTRMHSSRMRTGRSLTVCWSLLPGGGGGLPGPGGSAWSRGSAPRGGVPGWSGGAWSQGGCLVQGVCLVCLGVSGPGGSAWSGGGLLPGGYIPACTEADTPPPCGQTYACENITLAQLRCGR